MITGVLNIGPSDVEEIGGEGDDSRGTERALRRVYTWVIGVHKSLNRWLEGSINTLYVIYGQTQEQ